MFCVAGLSGEASAACIPWKEMLMMMRMKMRMMMMWGSRRTPNTGRPCEVSNERVPIHNRGLILGW